MLGHTLGRGRRDRGRVTILAAPRRLRAADDQPRRSRPGGRQGLDLTPNRRRAARHADRAVATRSGSAARTRRSSSGGGTHDRRRRPPAEPRRRPGRRPTARPDAAATGADARCSGSSTGWPALLDRSDLAELEVEAGGHGAAAAQAVGRVAAVGARGRRPRRRRAAGRDRRAADRRPRPGGAGPPVGQGAAHRALLHVARARARRRTSRSAARSPSARSSASSRR